MNKTIKELMQESHQTAIEKGWWEEDRNFGEQLALMHSELSEVLGEYRDYGLDSRMFIYLKRVVEDSNPEECIIDKPEGIAIEFADTLIRIFDTCEKYNIPLDKAIKTKMEFNKTRPYRHGGKKA